MHFQGVSHGQPKIVWGITTCASMAVGLATFSHACMEEDSNLKLSPSALATGLQLTLDAELLLCPETRRYETGYYPR